MRTAWYCVWLLFSVIGFSNVFISTSYIKIRTGDQWEAEVRVPQFEKLCSAGNCVLQKLYSAGNYVLQKRCSAGNGVLHETVLQETVLYRNCVLQKLCFAGKCVLQETIFYRNCVLQENVFYRNFVLQEIDPQKLCSAGNCTETVFCRKLCAGETTSVLRSWPR